MLGDASRSSTAMLTLKGTNPGLPFICKQVLQILNTLLPETRETSWGYGLHIEILKGELGGRLSGLFRGKGVIGMLEASEYDTF